MKNDLVEVKVKAVMPTSNGAAVFIGDDSKNFVIYIDQFIGATIQLALDGSKKERPLTHDLIGNILLGLGATVDCVIINDAKESTYFARLHLRMENEIGKKIIELDARPSDSMVLALQLNRPIYVARAVFEKVDDMSEILERIQKQQAENPGNPFETDTDDDEEEDSFSDLDTEDDDDSDDDDDYPFGDDEGTNDNGKNKGPKK